jgi:hypothetical protein
VDTLVGRLVGSSPRQPLETAHALLEDVERQVQPAGRGRWVFPFNRLTIELCASSREDKARLTAVIGDPDTLRERIADRLRPLCAIGPLEVRIRFRTSRPVSWGERDYHLDLERIETAPPAAHAPAPAHAPARARALAHAPARAPIELTVMNGAADRRRFSFTTDRIDIGRGAEVVDSRQRLLRRNQVAFVEDGSDINQTVSRRHAHILYREASREYRVYDDNSSRGTHIIRKGTTIPVPPGARGVALRSDDELVLGQARLRVRV